MKQEKEMKYEAPAVEVLEVETEMGFAASPTRPTDGSVGDITVPEDF